MNLRQWFLFPARVWTALFLAAPPAIVCAYRLLTPRDYGGVEPPLPPETPTHPITPHSP